MIPVRRSFIDSSAAVATIVLLFCAASGLAIYSSDCIGMTVGSRPQGILECIAGPSVWVFQPWLVLLDSLSARYNVLPFGSIRASLATAAGSAFITFAILFWLSRRFARIYRAILVALCFCTPVMIYSFIKDMQVLGALTYSGP